MTKILLFIDCLGAGGAQRQLVGLAIMLKKRGYYVKVCSYYDIDFFKNQLDEYGVQNELIPNAEKKEIRIFSVRKYFKHENPDWVISFQETPSLIASFVKLLGCNYRLIVSERNTTQVVTLNERVRFFLYHWVDAIVPNSHSQERFLVKHYPWMKSKLKTITNFVDLDHFNYVVRERRDFLEIVVVASIWEPKNTLGLIEAINILSKEGLCFHVSWYGKTEIDFGYFNKCQDLINSYKIGSYIQLHEKTKSIKEVYHHADFLCLPSFYEGTPNVICEAISTGLPIICSDICDNRLYVKNGVNGFLFDPHSVTSIAESIKNSLACKYDDYRVFSNNSRKIAERLLKSDVFISKYLSILE